MKKLLFIVLSATVLFSCNKGSNNGYTVSGTIDSVEDGEQVFIQLSNEIGEVTAIDSTSVKNGKFEFIGKTNELAFAYIQIGTLPWKIPFVLENEKITVTAYKDSLQASKTGGSYNNEELAKFNSTFERLQKKIGKFHQDNSETMHNARQSNDTAALNKFTKDYKALEDNLKNFLENYPSENPKSYISLILLSQMINNPSADFEKIKTNVTNLDSELKATKIGQKLEERINEISATSIGQIAPDFSAPNPEGKMVSLKESMGKVTLIDFWASWCGPCRVANPYLVYLHNEFHDKGLNIIGVSLDKEDQKEKWLGAIETDKLTWTQVSNLKFWQDPIAKQYSVQSIPATFLLDAEGKIVAKNLSGLELKAKIAELLGE